MTFTSAAVGNGGGGLLAMIRRPLSDIPEEKLMLSHDLIVFQLRDYTGI